MMKTMMMTMMMTTMMMKTVMKTMKTMMKTMMMTMMMMVSSYDGQSLVFDRGKATRGRGAMDRPWVGGQWLKAGRGLTMASK